MTTCHDYSLGASKQWSYIRPSNGCVDPIDLEALVKPPYLQTGDTRELVFVAQIPSPRDGVNLEFSPWFQSLLGLLSLEIEDDPNTKFGMNFCYFLKIFIHIFQNQDKILNFASKFAWVTKLLKINKLRGTN